MKKKDVLQFNDNYESRRRKKLIFRGVIILLEIGLAILLAYGICAFGVEKTTMIGDSMEGILTDGDKVIINKFAYRFSKPKRFDVICFQQNGKEHSYYNIKRVIGLPGETIQIKHGSVYVNGEEMEEVIDVEALVNGGLANEEITLDDNEYFVLGDNRNNSEDSRFANIGNIVADDIVGKVWIRLEPFNFINELRGETS